MKWIFGKCPVCGYADSVVFKRSAALSDRVDAYRWLTANIPGFLYVVSNPHPKHKEEEVWHIVKRTMHLQEARDYAHGV